MRAAIVGYGQMGKIIESILIEKGIEYIIVDKFADKAKYKTIEESALEKADVYIDFTVPAVVMDNIKSYCKIGAGVVMGTTGWYDKLDEVKKLVLDAGIGFIYSANFSVGVNVFFKIIEAAAKAINRFDDYDVFGYELHHNKKMDSPSGTATAIYEILLNNIERKQKVFVDKLDRRPETNELHFASIRAGSIPGTHVVGFDSEADTIELKHTARSKKGFAAGAVFAANWMYGKKGFFTKEDMMAEILR